MDVALLRATAGLRAEATSVRHVALEVGLTPQGLQKFLDGSEPQTATRRKLERWYIRSGAAELSGLDEESVAAAFTVLLQDFPAEHRPAARKALLDVLREQFDLAGLVLPHWLDRSGDHE